MVKALKIKSLLRILAYLPILIAFSTPANAEIVAPRDTVINYVVVRAADSVHSPEIARIYPEGSLPYLGSIPSWHKVRLPDSKIGFVYKRWTEVLDDVPPYFSSSQFQVHFIDVGVGDAAIIDLGEKEIVIDGGNYINDISSYNEKWNIIDGEIELLIVTHGDQDHWMGLRRLLGFDGVLDNPYSVQEFWDPGYDRDCNLSSSGRKNYLAFIENVKSIVTADKFKRPLENFHKPLDSSRNLERFSIESIPEVKFIVLHSQQNPEPAECSYMINNASIVLMIEIDGIKMLFTGDANGKKRKGAPTSKPMYVEQTILDSTNIIDKRILKADLLKAPHHGSETANTLEFINQVDPTFVVFSASTNHHLPRPTVVDRYSTGDRIIMSTDLNRKKMIDHIICGKSDGEFNCQYSVDLEAN